MKALFVCSKWFTKTKSQMFFVKLLKRKFQTKLLYGLDWKEGFDVETHKNYDIYVFWQILPPANQLSKIKGKKIIWVPLYDGKKGWASVILRKFTLMGFDIKAVCFSEKLHKIIKLFFPSKFIQFFPKPVNKKLNPNKPNVFLWQRADEINFSTIEKLFNFNEIGKVTIKMALDRPEQEKALPKHKKLTIVRGWQTKTDYEKMISEQDIIVAPRVSEGIGFGFLEPMSQGKIIVANNESTMNEYIKQGETGFLFNYKNPKRIRLNNLDIISANTKSFMKKGYKKWSEEKIQLLNWIEGE